MDAMPSRVPELCAICGQPVTNPAGTEAPHKTYHGECYRAEMQALGLLDPGPITAYSHDDKVRDGLEDP